MKDEVIWSESDERYFDYVAFVMELKNEDLIEEIINVLNISGKVTYREMSRVLLAEIHKRF